MGAPKRRARYKKSYDYRGVTYKSLFEVSVARKLAKAKAKFGYEKEKFQYEIPATLHNYVTDFRIVTKSGKVIFVETKGYFTKPDRDKAVYVRERNPDIDLRFVFQHDNKISKNSRTRYSTWCSHHGFQWAIGEVPNEWLEE